MERTTHLTRRVMTILIWGMKKFQKRVNSSKTTKDGINRMNDDVRRGEWCRSIKVRGKCNEMTKDSI